MAQQSSPAPGWYTDPSDPSLQRYWDGSAWRAPENSPPPPARSDSNKQIAVGIGVVVLVLIGMVMSMQSVSLLTGSGQIWTGVAMVAVGTALAFFLGAQKTVRVVATICLVLSAANVLYVESQMSERRTEIGRMFE